MDMTVPLLEMMRIDEHKNKIVALINNITMGGKDKVVVNQPKSCKSQEKNVEVKEVIDDNLKLYLGATITINPSEVNPFFLSLIIDGKFLRNCMIDSGASNNVTQVKIMEEMGLKVDITYGKFYDMDLREVLIIGVINRVPYKLVAYLEKELFMIMSIIVVDIPLAYRMLFSRH